MTKPDVVLLDLGNVLVSIHPEAFSQSLGIRDEEARTRYRSAVIDLVRRFEKGLVSSDDYFDHLKDLFGGRFSRDELTQGMLNVIGQPVKGMESVVSRISTKTTLGLVSNTNVLHFEHCRSSFPFINTFSHLFLSYQMKLLKPDPEYYQAVLGHFNISADRMLFIDDLNENIDAAREAGMQALQFTSAESLEQSLASLALLA